MRKGSLILSSAGLLSLEILSCFILEKHTPYFKEFSLRFVPSPKVVEALSINQKPFIADLFFARTAVHLGENYNTPEKRNLDWMYANLDIVTRLDPGFQGAYFLGGMVIPLGEEEAKLAISFLKEGMRRAPLDWHIPFWIGCNYYYELHDYLTSADYFAQAAKLPSAPGYLQRLRAMLYYKADQTQIALSILESLEESVRNKEEKKMLENKIAWLKNIIALEEMVKIFREKFGYLPESLDKLIAVGLLNNLPEDPFGKGYFLDKNTGHVKSLFFHKPSEPKEPQEAGVCNIHK